MKPPIFIHCKDGDVLVYDEPERAVRYVESPDVESGEYLAVFDSEGRRFALEPVRPTRVRKRWFITSIELTPVRLRPLEEAPSGAEELCDLLRRRLPHVPDTSGLEQLVNEARRSLPSP